MLGDRRRVRDVTNASWVQHAPALASTKLTGLAAPEPSCSCCGCCAKIRERLKSQTCGAVGGEGRRVVDGAAARLGGWLVMGSCIATQPLLCPAGSP